MLEKFYSICLYMYMCIGDVLSRARVCCPCTPRSTPWPNPAVVLRGQVVHGVVAVDHDQVVSVMCTAKHGSVYNAPHFIVNT